MKKQTANTVFFRYHPCNIPSVDHRYFESYFSEVGPVKKCSLIRASKREGRNVGGDIVPENRGFGFIKFLSQDDALTAAKTCDGITVNVDNVNMKLWVELASDAVKSRPRPSTHETQQRDTQVDTDPHAKQLSQEESDLLTRKKSCKVILRNVSFYATEKNIRKVMEEKFGKVIEVTLPLVPTLDDEQGDKSKKQQGHRGFAFVTFADVQSARKAVEQKDPITLKKRTLEISFSVSKFQHIHGKRKRSDSHEQMVESTTKLEKSDLMIQEETDEDEQVSLSSSSTNDDDDNSQNDGNVQKVIEENTTLIQQEQQQEEKQPIHNFSTENTLFLRNLPFDCTRHEIFTLLQRFGHIESIHLVKDKETGLGKGSAFVQFRDESSFIQALTAGRLDGEDSMPDATFVSSKKLVTGEASVTPYGTGLYLNGRRILIDKAIDRSTAETFKIERDEDGKPIGKKIGKDRRNLYLKVEGRVEEGSKTGLAEDAWEMLPKLDQEKRGRAHQEKSVKLRSPLFFINPFRLSIRNLSKHVDEAALRKLIVLGIQRGLENKLVTRTDLIAHWRAGGEMTMRDIMKKIADAELYDNDGPNHAADPIIPPFNEKLGIKTFIPSVYIDRDFESTKGSKKDAPSRGFGFVEFTHHAHALACLRELNNNPAYSAEYVSGGRKAVESKRRLFSRKEMRKRPAKGDDYPAGDDGIIRIPRLIVEFTVENKMMARKQAERRSLQLMNKSKQRSENKNGEKEATEVRTKQKRKGRGAMQREKKRLKMAEVTDKK